jgi:hypothetical protein
MANIFCTECGAKHPYAGIKPKFCASCGTNFQSESVKVRPTLMKAGRREENEEEEDVDEVPVLNKLSVKVESEARVTLGSLAPLNPVELEYSGEVSNYEKRTREEILARSVQDCLPVNKSKSIDE